MTGIPYSRHMIRASIVAFVFGCTCVVACGGIEIVPSPDGHTGQSADLGSGSGSDDMAMEPSPHDRNLELVVVASSLIVAVGPVVGSRRRRRSIPNIL
jgi:hypothetical protein